MKNCPATSVVYFCSKKCLRQTFSCSKLCKLTWVFAFLKYWVLMCVFGRMCVENTNCFVKFHIYLKKKGLIEKKGTIFYIQLYHSFSDRKRL